jgi:3-hydroxyisobutyrate dehydrogenase
MGPPYAAMKGKMMVEREFPPSFPLALSLKDARLVLATAERTGIRLPLIEVVAEQMERAVERGHGDADMAATIHATMR